MNKILFAALASATLAFTACSDDFLDRQPIGSYLDNEQTVAASEWNPQIMLSSVNACYSKLVQYSGDGDQSHFGQKFLDMSGDMMSGDMVKSTNQYGWFFEALMHQNYSVKSSDNDYIFKYCYQLIRYANQILDDAGGDAVEPEASQNKLYWAVAKTVRSYAYMDLLNFYSGAYDECKKNRCVPIYRTLKVEDPGAAQTVDSIYSFIKTDLSQAITAYENYGQDPTDLSMPSISVARTLLGYAYLNTGEYDKAAQVAVAATNSGHQILPLNQVLTTGFNSVKSNANNWLWGIDVTQETTGGLATFWGHMDAYTYSYASVGDFICINDTLFSQIPQNDIRRQWFIGDEEFQYYFGNELAPTNKFFDPNRILQGDAAWTNDVVYMRAEEPVLIAAEAYTRSGDVANGRLWLKKLLAERDTEGANGTLASSVDNLSADELLEAIHLNWRIELWGEGRGLMTMRRFHATNLIGKNTYIVKDQETSISYDDNRLILAIPQSEVNSNKNLYK